jgi:cyclophilin family peptidyl-prolyl cis-trans isomerase
MKQYKIIPLILTFLTAGNVSAADLEYVFGNPYTIFGQVFEGLDVVDAIGQTAVDENQKPREDITINSVSIETYQ